MDGTFRGADTGRYDWGYSGPENLNLISEGSGDGFSTY